MEPQQVPNGGDHSPKTEGDASLIRDNQGHYCPWTSEMVKGSKERWRHGESSPGPLAWPPVLCH